MIHGFDVSKYQDPDKLDFAGMAAQGMFLIARSSFGAEYKDPRFGEFAQGVRQHQLKFGAYHFYRQRHPVEPQLAIVREQLESIGGLQPGDLFPALDMEVYQPDGRPSAKLWNAACDQIGDAWKGEYGGCILYMSAYFPSYLHDLGNPPWLYEPGYRFWVAHYGRAPGKADDPYKLYQHGAYVHQHKGDNGFSELYAGGKAAIDHNAFTGDKFALDSAWSISRPAVAEPHRSWIGDWGLPDDVREEIDAQKLKDIADD